MVILGISCYYHDSAAVVLVNGDLIAAAEEERFSRVKHDNKFPILAIDFCLEKAGLSLNNIDYVAFYEKPLLKTERSLKILMSTFPSSLKIAPSVIKDIIRRQFGLRQEISNILNIAPNRVYFIEHHLSHAASAYYCSPFEEAATITIDGVGEWATTTLGYASTQKE